MKTRYDELGMVAQPANPGGEGVGSVLDGLTFGGELLVASSSVPAQCRLRNWFEVASCV